MTDWLKDDEPTDADWRRAAECIASDMDNFESYIWPTYRDHGLTKDASASAYHRELAQRIYEFLAGSVPDSGRPQKEKL